MAKLEYKSLWNTGRARYYGRLLAKASMVLALAGCASTVPARVTTFQKWPADAVGASWKLDTTQGQRDSLEYGQYADMVRSGMGPTGMVEAKPNQPARFAVSLSYGIEPVQVRIERPVYDPFYGPWGGGGPYGFGGFGHRGRGGAGFGWAMPFPPAWSSTTMDASRAKLTVEIRDTAHGNAKVYESTATNTGSGDSLPLVMPYLVRAIFDNFPDTNGQVREVSYEVGKP